MTQAVDPLLILCGGASRRMGQNKALLAYQQATLLSRLARFAAETSQAVWLSAGANEYVIKTPIEAQVPDALAGREGPLSAILGGLMMAQAQGVEALYVMACDTLITPPELVSELTKARATPAWTQGVVALSRTEESTSHALMPLLSRWHTALLPALKQYTIEQEQRRVMGFMAQLSPQQLQAVRMPESWHTLSNFNTVADFERATKERKHYDLTHTP